MTADRSKFFLNKKIKIKIMAVKINKHCYFLAQDLETWTADESVKRQAQRKSTMKNSRKIDQRHVGAMK